jgi:choice-of-anchor B domain-containing protein
MSSSRFAIFTTVLLFVCSFHLNAQKRNAVLVGQLNYQVLHQTNLNDVWGYVDGQGNEYALVGARKGVSIVSLADPSNPTEVYWHAGGESIWRDLKVFGNYAYITTEAMDGLLIIDLSPLPNGSITNTTNFFGSAGGQWQSAHNLWIDENGFAYIFGANRGQGGVIIYDLNNNPFQPQEVGEFDQWYVHDGYVRNDTMYLAHIYDGIISMVDISDKSNPILLGTAQTPSSFAHNIWPSDDGKFVFTTDEVSGGFLTAFDVSDPANIVEVGRTRSSRGIGVVPHNTHYIDGYIVTSYYADGLVVHDVKDPSNMVEVAFYDTYPGNSISTIGCWGAFPYLPSGLVLATDIENGLFVIDVDYVSAARMEGVIVNSTSNVPIQGVNVEILNDSIKVNSTLNGEYKIGTHSPGQKNIRFEKYAFAPLVINETLIAGETVQRNISLTPLPSYQVTFDVKSVTNQPLMNVFVKLIHMGEEQVKVTDGLGQVSFEVFYSDSYEIIAGQWGKITLCDDFNLSPQNNSFEIILKDGIYDDFTFDYGWQSFGNAERGHWERGVPVGAGNPGEWISPNEDSPNDCGNYAFVTGNSGDMQDNVHNGTVTLMSPVFDLSNYDEPVINYDRWFYNFHGPQPPNDTLRILLSNGFQTITIDKQGSNPAIFNQWINRQLKVRDFMTPTSTMQLIVSTSDFESSLNFVNAGFDHFFVAEEAELSTENQLLNTIDLSAYPNPTKDVLTIEGLEIGKKVQLIDWMGRIVIDWTPQSHQETISTAHLAPGVYLIRQERRLVRIVK